MNNRLIENDKTEFKSVLNEKLERVVVSFLNSKTGGDIFIGVADDGSILGVDNPDSIQLAISDRLKNNILPTCLGLFDVYSEEYENKIIIHIVVSSGTEKPYYIKSYGMSPAGCYMRVGSGVQKMNLEMIDRFYASRTRNSLRNIASPRYAPHTFAQLKIYYEERGSQLNDSFLHNLDFYTADGKYNYVAYLLADVNSVSIKVAKYSGIDKCDLIENEEYGFCSLIKATERVLDKLEIENKTYTKITGAAQRLERKMVDRIALREAFINAIVHNDYTREVPPLVEIFSNRLVITSYGGLIEGLSKEDFFNGRSMPRNRELMRIFRDLEYVEHLGSGMNRILRVYDRNIFHLTDNFLEIVFPFEEEYLRSIVQVTDQVTDQVRNIINVLEEELSRLEIMKKLHLNNRAHFLLDYLQPAIQENLIELSIPDKPKSKLQKYRLSKKGIKLKSVLNSKENDFDQVSTAHDTAHDTVHDTIHDTIHDTDQVTDQVRNLIRVLDGELSGLDIMKKLNLNHKPNFRLEYLQPAIKEIIVEMTIPDKPNSRLQKYRLTSKGKEIKAKLNQ